MIQNLFFLFFLSAVSVMSLFGMDSHLLKPAKPTPKTKKPTLLFEYFGLTERFGEQSAINVKQLVVQRLLNARPQWQKKTTVCHQDVHSVVYSNDRSVLATAGSAAENDTLCISDREGRILRTKKFSEKIRGMLFHPTDQSLIVCSDKIFEKIDAQGKTLKTIHAGLDPVKCVLNPHKHELAAIDNNGLLKIWSLAGGAPFQKDYGLQGILDLACHDSGDIFAFVRLSYVLLFERSSGETLALHHDAGINSVVFKPQSNTLVTGSIMGLLTLWEYKKAETGRPFKIEDWEKKRVINADHLCHSCIDVIKFHPRGHLFATIQRHCDKIKLWDTEGNNIAIIPYGTGGTQSHSFTFHPTMHEFAVSASGNLVEIWQQEEFPTLEQLLLKLILKQYLVKCLAARRKPGYPASFSPDNFIDWMSGWFFLEKETLSNTWRTFSNPQKVALIKTYIAHAKKVGDI